MWGLGGVRVGFGGCRLGKRRFRRVCIILDSRDGFRDVEGSGFGVSGIVGRVGEVFVDGRRVLMGSGGVCFLFCLFIVSFLRVGFVLLFRVLRGAVEGVICDLFLGFRVGGLVRGSRF